MNKKIFENTRFCPKGDIEANWNRATGFIPLEREIIIYKADEKHPNPRIKIGDGKTGIKDLPFVTENIQANYEQNDISAKDYIKNRPFYTTTGIKEILNSTYTSTNNGDYTYAEISLSETLEEIPSMINVTLDGIEYSNLAELPIDKSLEDIGFFGNANIMDSAFEDTGEPFMIGLLLGDPTIAMVGIKETKSTVHSIMVTTESEIVIKLPEKYLPTSILETANNLQAQIAEIKDNVNNLPKIVYVDGLPPYFIPGNNVSGLEPLLNSGAAVGDYVIFKNGDFGRVTTYRHPQYGTTTLWVDVNPIGSGGKVWISNANDLDSDIPETYLFDSRLNNGDFVLKPDSGKLWRVDHRTMTGSWCLQPVKNTIIDYLDQRIAELAGSVTTVTFNIEEAGHSVKLQNLEGITKINWGDGTINSELSHTFAIVGEYKCKIYDVTSIGDEAFRWADLTSIIIPNSVTSIGDCAFGYCLSLTSITISDSVTSIGKGVFAHCESLTNIIFKSLEPLTYDSSWFEKYSIPIETIYVPYGCKQAYIDKWTVDGASQDVLDRIVESDREAMISDVNAGLDEKLDKTGGLIGGDLSVQGNLTVSGKTTTLDTVTLQVQDNVIVANADGAELVENAGFAMKTSETSAYGIMYDPNGDGVKIGLGSFDENGKFIYDEGEAQFLATRADTIVDGHTVVWDNDAKQLVDSGVGHDEYVKFTDYATASKAGVSKFLSTRGISINANGEAYIERADKSLIEGKSNPYRPIVPLNQDYAWKQSATDNKETWTDEDKAKACETIGAVKKVANAGSMNVVYGEEHSGKGFKMFTLASGGTGDMTIPMRNANGQFDVRTPQSNLNVANKQYVDENFVSKTEVAETYTANTIPKRTATGTINTNDPQWGNEATNKRYVDGGFVAKFTNPDNNPNKRFVLYGAYSNSGTMVDDTIQYSSTPKDFAILQYNSGGNVKVAEPRSDDDATTKKYVDDLVGDINTALETILGV